MSKVDDILGQVRKTKEIMLKNMDALFERGQKLETLKDKTANLEEQAKLFAEAAHELQKRAKNRYMALTFIIIGLSIGAVYTLASGYSTPIVIAGCAIGAALGYTVNYIRNYIVETFWPSNAQTKPTASTSSKNKNRPDNDLEVKLQESNALLNAFNNAEVASDPATAIAAEAFKAKFRL